MPTFSFTQSIKQLPKRQGGYFYLKVDAEIIDQYEKKRHTRLVCTIDEQVSYSCGLNHLGDGNYFIIVATKWLKKLKKELGDTVNFEIGEDPNPLGVAVPEVLSVYLGQDEWGQGIWERITDGKKRSLIYSIAKLKNIDRQIEIIQEFLQKEHMKLKSKL